MAEVLHCDRCGAVVREEDLREGLAIRMGSDLVCPVCVDSLPADTQLRINQIRAMRGLDSTTYRVQNPRIPKAQLYTFSTSANLIKHRRTVRESGRFEAPILPPRQKTVAHQSVAKQAAKDAAREATSEKGLPVPVIAGIAGGILVLIAVIALWPKRPDTTPIENDPNYVDPVAQAESFLSLPPRDAWDKAMGELDSNHPLRERLTVRLIESERAYLQQAQNALAKDDIDSARLSLDRLDIPIGLRFDTLRERERTRRERLRNIIQEQARNRTPEPPAPEPEQPKPDDSGLVASNNSDSGTNTASQQTPNPANPEPTNPEAPETPSNGEQPTVPQDDAITENTPEPQGPNLAELAHFISPLQFLLPPGDSDEWDKRDNNRMKLLGDSASLSRTLTLPAGEWRIWVKAHTKNETAQLVVSLGSETALGTNISTGTRYAWHGLDTPITLSSDGETDIRLTFVGSGWFVESLCIADARITDPADEALQQTAIAWQPWPKPPAPEPEARRLGITFPGNNNRSEIYDSLNTWDAKALSSLPRGSKLPAMISGLPGNTPAEIQASKSNRRVYRGAHTISTRLPAIDLSKGGFSLLMHPGRLDRKSVLLRLNDSKGRAAPEPLRIALKGEFWQTITVPIPPEWSAPPAEGEPPLSFDPSAIQQLTIVDENDDLSTAFYVSKIIASEDEPSDDHLRIRPRALSRATVLPIRQLKKLNTNNIKVLLGHQFNDSFITEMRASLAAIYQVDKMKNGAVDHLVMADQPLNQTFIKEWLSQAVKPNHIVVVATGGVEFAIGLDRKKALENFWAKMMEEALRSNFQPVVVLGPSKLDPEKQADAEALWQDLYDLITNDGRFASVPIIDLRSVQIVDFQRFAPGNKKLAVEMLSEGIAELRARIQSLQKR